MADEETTTTGNAGTTSSSTKTTKKKDKDKKNRPKSRDRSQSHDDAIAQIAEEAAERVADITPYEEEVWVTIEELPPGSTVEENEPQRQPVHFVNQPVPMTGLIDLAAVPVTLMRATYDFWGTLVGSMLDMQKNTMTRVFDQTIDQSRELTSQVQRH